MISHDFEWNDILEGHYLFSLLICVLAVIITFIISKKYDAQSGHDISSVIHDKKKHHKSELDNMADSDGTSASSSPVIKKLPVVAAEKVIKENMTEEQRKLENEVRQKQLAQIYELMMKQSDKFGNISLSDVEEQMKLYQ